MERSPPIEVKASRKKAMWILPGAVLLTGLGILAFVAGIALAADARPGFTAASYMAAGMLAIVLFSYAIWSASRTLVTGAGVLFIIGREGLEFRRGHYRYVGLLEWPEITAVRLLDIHRTRVLGIDVADRKRLENGAGRLVKAMLRMSDDMGLPPIQIPATAVDMRLDELLLHIERYRSNPALCGLKQRNPQARAGVRAARVESWNA